MGTLIIFGIYGIVNLTVGFYFGYLKREKEPPQMPMVEEFKELGKEIRRYTRKKDKDTEPKSFYD